MKVKEALKIIREIDSQRQALDKIGEVLEVAEGIERDIKDLERQRERLKLEVADEAKREHKAAAALLEAQHANEIQRMKTELDRLAQSLRNARVEHESKLAAFEREEQEAKKKVDTVRAEIKTLTDRFRESASNLAHAPGAD
ncbi:MAG: hypothetical protein ACE10M_01695 [Alphaproteobacteria bacterium]